MEGNESWYICCEKIVGLFRQAPQNLFKRFVHTFFFQQQVLLGGRLQMVRKLEPSWHHLSGSGYLVPWTLGVLNGIAAWLKWTEPLSPSGGDAYFVSAKGCDQQGNWGGKIYTKQVSEDPTIHDQVFKSHFSRLRGDLDTIIRRCNPPIRSSMNTSTHMDDETQSLGHKPLHCSNLARWLLCFPDHHHPHPYLHPPPHFPHLRFPGGSLRAPPVSRRWPTYAGTSLTTSRQTYVSTSYNCHQSSSSSLPSSMARQGVVISTNHFLPRKN